MIRPCAQLRVGVQLVGDDGANTPPVHDLAKRGIVGNVHGYMIYGELCRSRRAAVPDHGGGRTRRHRRCNRVGPVAGYFAAREKAPLSTSTRSPSIPQRSTLPMTFDIAAGVRKSDEALAQELNRAIEQRRPRDRCHPGELRRAARRRRHPSRRTAMRCCGFHCARDTAHAVRRVRRGKEDCRRDCRRSSHRKPAGRAGATRPRRRQAPVTKNAEAQKFDGNPEQIAAGRQLFMAYNCVGCHFNGGGGIGPPLMDSKWIYGSSMENIASTIREGRPNGMPSFRAMVDGRAGLAACRVRTLAQRIGPTTRRRCTEMAVPDYLPYCGAPPTPGATVWNLDTAFAGGARGGSRRVRGLGVSGVAK